MLISKTLGYNSKAILQIITSFLRMYWCYNRDAIFYPLPWRAYTSIPWTTILLKWHKYDRTMNLHKVYISSSEVCLTKVSNIFATSCSHGWRRQWHPTPVLLPGKSHGWRSLVDCSPWGHEESDTPERLHFPFSLPCIGEGNGNPLQYSCLENPRDSRAWWAPSMG